MCLTENGSSDRVSKRMKSYTENLVMVEIYNQINDAALQSSVKLAYTVLVRLHKLFHHKA
jgi:hypothetical protein